jgi:hypothetical protein
MVSKHIPRASTASVVVIRFDPARTCSFRREEVDHLAYPVARLITGQGTAASEWTHLGFSIELEEKMDQSDDHLGRV